MSHARLYIAADIDTAALPTELRTKSTDIEHHVFSTFGIGEARELQKRAYILPVTRPTREFLIHFDSITVEAQNALLKLFEEPPECSVFHIVVSRSDILIPTLRSRLLFVDEQVRVVDRGEIRDFLKLSYGERVEEIATRTKKKDVTWIEGVAAGAEEFIVTRKTEHRKDLLESLTLVRQYLGTRGASSKMLLEELALSLPILK